MTEMLRMDDTFLREEERDGFTVPAMMKRAWAAELKMLDQLQDFFKAHQLTYFAEVGTLLGAIRHQGFIPWDDDLDIGMPREDYMKLQSLAGQLPEPLRLKSFYVQEDFNQFHTVVSNCREAKLTWDEKRMEEYYGCPFIVGIDIFPFDYIPADPNMRKLQKLLYNMAHVMAFSYDEVFQNPSDSARMQKYEKDLHTVEEYCHITFDYDEAIKPQIWRLADNIAMQCKEADAAYFDYYPRMVLVEDATPYLREKEWYQSYREVPYEMTTINVPTGAEKALERFYGDWKTPVYVGTEHEYPFYKKQVEFFELAGYGEELKNIGT